jgi:uncharacterized protein
MDKKEQRNSTLKVEIREEQENESKKITGYAVKWGEKSSPIFGLFEEVFERGAFSDSLSGDVIAAWDHNRSEILGRTPGTLILEEDEVGLRYEITPPNWADKYIESVERGDVRGSSFIFVPEIEEWDESGEMALRTVKKANLYEVSPVIYPAYPTSEAGIRSANHVYQEFKDSKQQHPDTYREKYLDLLERKY